MPGDLNLDDAHVAALSELEHLRLRNLWLQHRLLRERLNGLISQFLQTAEPRTLQDGIEMLTREINTAAAAAFAARGLDPKECRLHVDLGVFVRCETTSTRVSAGASDVNELRPEGDWYKS